MSVVIPTYQRREAALRCLEPVLEDPGTWEVLMVVDGSTDGTEGSIRKRFGHRQYFTELQIQSLQA